MGKKLFALLLWLAGPFAAGAIGSIASINASEFYRQMQRPDWAPPSWLFGPAWTTLYLLMGIAAWLVWKRAGWSGARGPLLLFLIHLPVNAVWSWFFFAWQMGTASVACIVLLWLMIAMMIGLFARTSRLAAAMLVPYLLWVSYATALNVAIVRANPTLLP